MLRIYLAGPDLFRPDAAERAASMRALCREAGFEPLHPLDGPPPVAFTPAAAGAIYAANVAMVRRCDALIANLSPFRGPSADVGTAFELGLAAGLGRPAFAWSDAVVTDFAERIRLLPADGMMVEEFGLSDNLMLESALAAPLMIAPDLGGFICCLDQAARYFAG